MPDYLNTPEQVSQHLEHLRRQQRIEETHEQNTAFVDLRFLLRALANHAKQKTIVHLRKGNANAFLADVLEAIQAQAIDEEIQS